jgi:hypothetical protein
MYIGRSTDLGTGQAHVFLKLKFAFVQMRGGGTKKITAGVILMDSIRAAVDFM